MQNVSGARYEFINLVYLLLLKLKINQNVSFQLDLYFCRKTIEFFQMSKILQKCNILQQYFDLLVVSI